PPFSAPVLAAVNTEDVTDHLHRQWNSQPLDKVEAGKLANTAQAAVDDLSDRVGHLLDSRGCETPAHNSAHPGVLGRVSGGGGFWGRPLGHIPGGWGVGAQ